MSKPQDDTVSMGATAKTQTKKDSKWIYINHSAMKMICKQTPSHHRQPAEAKSGGTLKSKSKPIHFQSCQNYVYITSIWDPGQTVLLVVGVEGEDGEFNYAGDYTVPQWRAALEHLEGDPLPPARTYTHIYARARWTEQANPIYIPHPITPLSLIHYRVVMKLSTPLKINSCRMRNKKGNSLRADKFDLF